MTVFIRGEYSDIQVLHGDTHQNKSAVRPFVQRAVVWTKNTDCKQLWKGQITITKIRNFYPRQEYGFRRRRLTDCVEN